MKRSTKLKRVERHNRPVRTKFAGSKAPVMLPSRSALTSCHWPNPSSADASAPTRLQGLPLRARNHDCQGKDLMLI
jgi:hypothetical protein